MGSDISPQTFGEVGTPRRILTATNAEDLDRSDLLFGRRRSADFMGGFQWSVAIGGGGFQSSITQFGSDAALEDPSVSAVPEPGLVLLAGLDLMGLPLVGSERD